MKEVLFVNIGYENGLYTFKNDDICPEIPEEIMVNTPFYNQENSFEELLDTISMEPEDEIVFAYRYENQILVKRLARILSKEYGKTVYLVNPKFEKDFCHTSGESSIYLLTGYERLESVDEIEFEVLAELPELVREEDWNVGSGYFVTMRNGYDAFVTGIYPENMSNTLAKHVLLQESAVIEDAAQHLDVNGAFLINKDKECQGEVRDVDCFNHIHTITDRYVQFDSSKANFKNIVCSYSQFKDWKENQAIDSEYEYYLRIENEQDLDGFAEELEMYQATAKINTIASRLVDECRWTNQCSLKRLPRYRVSDEMVKPCLTSERTLLSMQTESAMQLLEANKLCDSTMIQRKCMECSMKSVCSRCACLPENISQEKFCGFMHKYPFVGEYLLKKRIVNFLGRFSKIFEEEDCIEVSSSLRCFEYPNEEKKEIAKRNVFVFRKGQDYYVLHMQKGNLMKLEKKYVFLLEAWALEAPMDTVIKNASKQYNLDISHAKMVVEEGYEHLKKGGMIS